MSAGGEQILYGMKACWAAFTYRSQDILRVYHRADRSGEVAPLLKWAASRRLPYRELDEAGLRRVAGSPHHEGLVLAMRPLRYGPPAGPVRPPGWVALDGVENPHNVGAIVRTCAFFGIEAVLVGGAAPGGKVNAATLRAAEGGAERVRLAGAQDLAQALASLRGQGAPVIGLETGAPEVLGGRPLPRPAVLVAGHERRGLSREVRAACGSLVSIPGSGGVDSLNVSVTVGIAVAELCRPAPGAARKGREGRRRRR